MARTFLPITKSNFLVQLQGLDFYFDECSGIEEEAETTDYSDGLSYSIIKLVGPRSLSPITIAKAFDPLSDSPIIDWYYEWCEQQNSDETLAIIPVRYCPEPEPFGKSFTVYNVKPTKIMTAEVDKTSTDVSRLEIEVIGTHYSWN